MYLKEYIALKNGWHANHGVTHIHLPTYTGSLLYLIAIACHLSAVLQHVGMISCMGYINMMNTPTGSGS
jgi:hypothetical protein